jgi:hypothetical protein
MTSYDFQPGDGSRYFIQLFESEHVGIFVINHKGDQLKFLIGNNNQYTHDAIWNFLEALE